MPEVPPAVHGDPVAMFCFFEERAAQLTASMIGVVTWILSFTAILLGYGVNDALLAGGSLWQPFRPAMLILVAGAGLVLLLLATIVLVHHGAHVRRHFARANAAKDGRTSLQQVWESGQRPTDRLPAIYRLLLVFVGLAGLLFAALLGAGVVAIIAM